eukprot:GHVS01018732.1.p1 GENE.GHVS01018732.1~~GHVS01018732.1.p1  ORF type:complete len:407 (+),score=140.87 GHVS01018732.1:52-1221(+)
MAAHSVPHLTDAVVSCSVRSRSSSSPATSKPSLLSPVGGIYGRRPDTTVEEEEEEVMEGLPLLQAQGVGGGGSRHVKSVDAKSVNFVGRLLSRRESSSGQSEQTRSLMESAESAAAADDSDGDSDGGDGGGDGGGGGGGYDGSFLWKEHAEETAEAEASHAASAAVVVVATGNEPCEQSLFEVVGGWKQRPFTSASSTCSSSGGIVSSSSPSFRSRQSSTSAKSPRRRPSTNTNNSGYVYDSPSSSSYSPPPPPHEGNIRMDSSLAISSTTSVYSPSSFRLSPPRQQQQQSIADPHYFRDHHLSGCSDLRYTGNQHHQSSCPPPPPLAIRLVRFLTMFFGWTKKSGSSRRWGESGTSIFRCSNGFGGDRKQVPTRPSSFWQRMRVYIYI